MFFKSRHKKKKKNKGGKVYSTSGGLKGKKRFGLTRLEMDSLVENMVMKSKIPVAHIK